MAEYLPETLESVLSQDYPQLEYIVADGGSTDGTVDLLEKNKHRLRYISAPDGGAADAINRGFALSTGSILAWLNADDTYLPGAVAAAVRHLMAEPDAAAVYGQGYWVDSQGAILKAYPTHDFNAEALGEDCYICQPACFMRRSAFLEIGGVDAALRSAFDYDLWIRMARRHRLTHVTDYLATTRMHPESKTLGNRREVFQEGIAVLKRHFRYVPFPWIYSRICHLLDKRDQFFQPLQPSLPAYCLSLPWGLLQNWRHPVRYSIEWFRVMSRAGLLRMWNRSALGKMSGRPTRF
jgi:glycosyltransferase involved in cell wall biosynthesis